MLPLPCILTEGDQYLNLLHSSPAICGTRVSVKPVRNTSAYSLATATGYHSWYNVSHPRTNSWSHTRIIEVHQQPVEQFRYIDSDEDIYESIHRINQEEANGPASVDSHTTPEQERIMPITTSSSTKGIPQQYKQKNVQLLDSPATRVLFIYHLGGPNINTVLEKAVTSSKQSTSG